MSLILSGTDGLSEVDGTAATPAIRGTDANTGIFFPAADTIGFAEGGAEVMRIDSSGDVGIGKSTITAKLDVQRTSGTTEPIGRFEAAVGGYTGTSLIAANTLGPDSAYNLFSCISDSDGDGGGPFTEFLVRGDGNVGIGTTAPGYKLDVQSSASSGAPLLANFQAAGGDVQVYIQNGTVKTQITADATNSASIIGSFSNHPVVFRTNNTERARIDTSGNLLVGTTSNLGGDGSILQAYGEVALGLRTSGTNFARFYIRLILKLGQLQQMAHQLPTTPHPTTA
jgi:hypothetical protein